MAQEITLIKSDEISSSEASSSEDNSSGDSSCEDNSSQYSSSDESVDVESMSPLKLDVSTEVDESTSAYKSGNEKEKTDSNEKIENNDRQLKSQLENISTLNPNLSMSYTSTSTPFKKVQFNANVVINEFDAIPETISSSSECKLDYNY